MNSSRPSSSCNYLQSCYNYFLWSAISTSPGSIDSQITAKNARTSVEPVPSVYKGGGRCKSSDDIQQGCGITKILCNDTIYLNKQISHNPNSLNVSICHSARQNHWHNTHIQCILTETYVYNSKSSYLIYDSATLNYP